ncbi:MAG TPA: TIGR03118 family protein [Chitinophagaceae bacterium]|nr:TIGR03118 family protein [Chitinophagaceae bacterium]
MKNTFKQGPNLGLAGIAAIVCFSFVGTGCQKDNTTVPGGSTKTYDEVKLVADESSSGAAQTDPNLKNPWGIAISSSGTFWVSANGTGTSTIYDNTGASVLTAISIPAPGSLMGKPTGIVANTTSDFTLPVTGEVSKFIFSTENGSIAAWSSAGAAVTVADRSESGAMYKGLAIANDGTANFIYAADFKNGKIDVFDHSFAYVTTGKPFTDSSMPSGFAPFNIRNVDGMLYVTYAKQGADGDEVNGAGNGYIDVYKPDGTMVSRFATQGSLNSPWGIAMAPETFGFGQKAILVSNFGDGHINAFAQDGTSLGELKDSSNNAVSINGLWDIAFPSSDSDQLYFTAGGSDETHGLFGYLKIH